jgi:hypothetical protein
VNQLILAAGGKASDVIDAMIQGLRNPPKGFVVSLDAYGKFDENVRYGNIETLALMHVTGVILTPEEIENSKSRAKAIEHSEDDLLKFEWAIKDLRWGQLVVLEMITETRLPKPKTPLTWLKGDNWRQGLLAYGRYRDQLKKVGL